MNNNHWLYLASVLSGAVIWIAISLATNQMEAWDSDLYYSVGLPASCLLSFMFGLYRPRVSWKWGVLLFVGQFLALLVIRGPGNLLPLGVIAFGIFSLPAILTARIGASLAARFGRPDEGTPAN